MANEKKFAIDGIGDFVLRRPSMIDQVTIARQRIAMIGADASINVPEWVIAHTMALINTTATSKPFGFDWTDHSYDLANDKEWQAFYTEYNEWLDSFRSPASGSPAASAS